jgi:hypothetical protein
LSVGRELRTVIPLTVGIRDGAAQLVSTVGSVVISVNGGAMDDTTSIPTAASGRRGYA